MFNVILRKMFYFTAILAYYVVLGKKTGTSLGGHLWQQ